MVESLPVPMRYFAFAAMILIAAMAVALWGCNRFLKGVRPPSSVLRPLSSVPHGFAIPALLFVIFGMWASKAAAPQFPQGLQAFLNGQAATLISPKSRPHLNIIRTKSGSLSASSGQ